MSRDRSDDLGKNTHHRAGEPLKDPAPITDPEARQAWWWVRKRVDFNLAAQWVAPVAPDMRDVPLIASDAKYNSHATVALRTVTFTVETRESGRPGMRDYRVLAEGGIEVERGVYSWDPAPGTHYFPRFV